MTAVSRIAKKSPSATRQSYGRLSEVEKKVDSLRQRVNLILATLVLLPLAIISALIVYFSVLGANTASIVGIVWVAGGLILTLASIWRGR